MNTNERIKIFKSLMGQVFGKEDVDYFVATLRRMGYFTSLLPRSITGTMKVVCSIIPLK